MSEGPSSASPFLGRNRSALAEDPLDETSPGSSLWRSFNYAIRYLISATKHDKEGWAIGTLTVFLVVLFLGVLQTNITKSPLIFLKLTEDTFGEIDLMMTPRPTNSSPAFFLNYTDINRRIATSTLAVGATPRWYLLGHIQNRDHPDRNTSVMVVVLDTDKEEEIGLGRAWPHRVLGEREVHVTASVLRDIGIRPNRGDRANLVLDLESLAKTFGVLDDSTGIADLIGGNATVPPIDTGNLNVTRTTLEQALANLGIDPATVPDATLDTIVATFDARNDPAGALDSDLVQQLSELLGVNLGNNNGDLDLLRLTAEFTVVDEVPKTKGKYPSALGNVAIVDSKFIARLLRETVGPILTNPIAPAVLGQDFVVQASLLLNNFRITDFALTVCVLYTARAEAYLLSGKDLQKHMIAFSDDVMEALGDDYPMEATLPISTGLESTVFIRLFLDQIFNFVVFILCFLGGMLIFSLLLSDVEQKTYEYGMLRALGMRQHTLIEMLLTQAMMFAIPGICFGLFFAFLIDIPIAIMLGNFSSLPPKFGLAPSAILTGVFLGIAVPLLANYVPIRRALSKTLRDSLDVYHQVVSETVVNIIRLENLGLSPWQTGLAIIMVVVGFVTYYLIPYSFTFQDFGLFFTILNGILLGMLFGLSMISQVIQPFLERWCLKALLWGNNRRLGPIVSKNLSGHRPRNKKTALMFTTALAFLIFAGALFTLQTKLIQESLELFLGADIVVQSLQWGTPLNEDAMRDYLTRVSGAGDSLVKAFTFVTPDLRELDVVNRIRVSTLTGFSSSNALIYGVEADYLDACYSKYLRVTQSDDSFEYEKTEEGKKDVIRSLYKDAGKARLPVEAADVHPPLILSQFRAVYDNTSEVPFSYDELAFNLTRKYDEYIDVIVSQGVRERTSISLTTPIALRFTTTNDTFIHMAKARAVVSKVPGFFFSSYRSFSFFSPVLLTMDSYQRILEEILENEDSTEYTNKEHPKVAPKARLMIRAKKGATRDDREAIANNIRNFIDDDLTQVIDTRSLLESTEVAINMLILFFNIVALIASILSFFVLVLSFTANVRENAWELGVLRAVGLPGRDVVLVFMLEALAIVMACTILGCIIGMLVAITLTLQMGLFTESLFQFAFPYTLFFSILAMALIVAVLGSWLPARKAITMQVAHAIKGT